MTITDVEPTAYNTELTDGRIPYKTTWCAIVTTCTTGENCKTDCT